MSIAVLVGVHDGLVIAADSASTLTISLQPGAMAGVANVYDNANKIFNLYKGKPIGCVTYGAGSIGNSSIGTLIKDLRQILTNPETAKPLDFDPSNYSMEDVSKIVVRFLGEQCAKETNPAIAANTNIGLMLGGYSTGRSLGESWSIEIKAGKPTEPKQLRAPNEAGISWGGMGEALQRIVLGFSPMLFNVLAEVSGAQGQPPVTAEQLFTQLNPLLGVRPSNRHDSHITSCCAPRLSDRSRAMAA